VYSGYEETVRQEACMRFSLSIFCDLGIKSVSYRTLDIFALTFPIKHCEIHNLTIIPSTSGILVKVNIIGISYYSM